MSDVRPEESTLTIGDSPDSTPLTPVPGAPTTAVDLAEPGKATKPRLTAAAVPAVRAGLTMSEVELASEAGMKTLAEARRLIAETKNPKRLLRARVQAETTQYALVAHLTAWQAGDVGEDHLGHAACRCLMALDRVEVAA